MQLASRRSRWTLSVAVPPSRASKTTLDPGSIRSLERLALSTSARVENLRGGGVGGVGERRYMNGHMKTQRTYSSVASRSSST